MASARQQWTVWWSASECVAAQWDGASDAPVLRRIEHGTGHFEAFESVIGRWRDWGIPVEASLTLIPDDLGLLTKHLQVPVVDPSKQAETLASEVAQSLPSGVNEVQWDSLLLADDGVEQEYLLVAARRSALEAMGAALLAAGYRPESVGTAPTLEALAWRVRGQGTEPTLLIHLGRGVSHLIYLWEERFFVRSTKLGCPSGVKAETFVPRLKTEVLRSTAAFRRQFPAGAPESLVVHGVGEAAVLGEPLAEALGLPLKREVSSGADLDPEGLAGFQRPLLPLLAAALIAADRPESERVNLLPESLRVHEVARTTSRRGLAACVLGVLGALAFAGGEFVATTQAQAALAQRTQAVAPVAATMDAMRAEYVALDGALDRIRSVEGLVRSRTNWLEFLSDLQTRLVAVEDVWIDRLVVARATVEDTAPPREPWEMELEPVDRLPPPARYELQLEGRMLDRRNPLARVSADMRGSVSDLLDRFAESAFVASVDDKRFDTSEKGVLRFTFTLTLNPERPL